MFSVFPSGNIRWKSKLFGNIPDKVHYANTPSIHPDGHVYFINSNYSTLFVLSTEDGSVVKSYNITCQYLDCVYTQPPIIVGSVFLYLTRLSLYMYPSFLRVEVLSLKQ